jgi:hypothetical protein
MTIDEIEHGELSIVLYLACLYLLTEKKIGILVTELLELCFHSES